MFAEITLLRIYAAPHLRISGTVTDPAGNPLSRRVILYDESGAAIAETTSAPDGTAAFVVSGANGNNRFVARAVGHAGECDDISCPLTGEAIS